MRRSAHCMLRSLPGLLAALLLLGFGQALLADAAPMPPAGGYMAAVRPLSARAGSISPHQRLGDGIATGAVLDDTNDDPSGKHAVHHHGDWSLDDRLFAVTRLRWLLALAGLGNAAHVPPVYLVTERFRL